VKPCLEKLKTDQDNDVQFYALEALDGKFAQNVTIGFLSNLAP